MREDELISKARMGSKEAFSDLIDLYSPVVQRFAYQLGNRYEEIDDVTQEVFIRVYRFLDQFSQAKFTTWLYKITLNVTRDFSRSKQRQLMKVFKIQNEPANHSHPLVEENVLRSEEDQILHDCIQRLDEKYRIPIILFYFHDKKYDEIAEIMGISMPAVKTRLLRGKEHLKKLLAKVDKREGEIHG